MNTLENWRIQDIESKAEQAVARLHELAVLREELNFLRHLNRGLTLTVESLKDELARLTVRIEFLEQT